MTVSRTHLLGVTNVADAVRLFGQLGYLATPRPLDAADVGVPTLGECTLLRRGSKRREGYAVLIGEVDRPPRSLLALCKAVRIGVHDRPLVVVGVRSEAAHWSWVIVCRPRVVGRGLTVTKLDVH